MICLLVRTEKKGRDVKWKDCLCSDARRRLAALSNQVNCQQSKTPNYQATLRLAEAGRSDGNGVQLYLR